VNDQIEQLQAGQSIRPHTSFNLFRLEDPPRPAWNKHISTFSKFAREVETKPKRGFRRSYGAVIQMEGTLCGDRIGPSCEEFGLKRAARENLALNI
jgi:hypothetical protein